MVYDLFSVFYLQNLSVFYRQFRLLHFKCSKATQVSGSCVGCLWKHNTMCIVHILECLVIIFYHPLRISSTFTVSVRVPGSTPLPITREGQLLFPMLQMHLKTLHKIVKWTESFQCKNEVGSFYILEINQHIEEYKGRLNINDTAIYIHFPSHFQGSNYKNLVR